VVRSTVERLKREMDLKDTVCGRKVKLTATGAEAWAAILVERRFRGRRPSQLWVTDLTYVGTDRGFAYAASISDASARRPVG